MISTRRALRRGRYQHRFSVSWARREARKRKLDLAHVAVTAVY